SLVDVLVQSVSFRVWDSEAEQRSKCDVLILPDVRGFSTFGFTRASEVIARGEVAGRAALPRNEAALAQRRASRHPTAPRRPVVLRERSGGRFGVGLRYDSRYKASVLLSSTLGRIAGGFSGRADARLGQQIQVGAGVSQPLGDGRSVKLGAEADYVRSPFDLYQGDHRVAQARVDLGALTGSLARSLGTAVDVSIRVKAEHARWGEDVSAVASPPINRTFYTV